MCRIIIGCTIGCEYQEGGHVGADTNSIMKWNDSQLLAWILFGQSWESCRKGQGEIKRNRE